MYRYEVCLLFIRVLFGLKLSEPDSEWNTPTQIRLKHTALFRFGKDV